MSCRSCGRSMMNWAKERDASHMKELRQIFHKGELQAQRRFNPAKTWSESAVASANRMFKQRCDDETAYFIEAQRFFFIATADEGGNCDCSFRGTEADEGGGLLKAVHVESPTRLVFPDYAGNNIYNSLGNMLANPRIGILFIDFEKAFRLRVNGTANIIEDNAEYLLKWPKALRFVVVTIEQLYWNCPRRIRESVPGN